MENFGHLVLFFFALHLFENFSSENGISQPNIHNKITGGISSF